MLVAVGLAGVAVLAIGPDPALVGALALAAVAPRLVRVDLAEHRLPNRLVTPALLAGVVGFGLSWLAPSWLALSWPALSWPAPSWPAPGVPALVPLLAGAIYAGALFMLALAGGMGMGDVKLAAALGLASPTAAIALTSPVLAFVFGGVAAVVILIRRGRKARIAFGPFLLAGYFGALVVAAVLAP
jgi:leader peptidase (prepilin peptidase)/N-methyltransferase